METKICSKCGRLLPIDQFNFRDKIKGTRRADCKECHSGYMKLIYQKKKEIIQEWKSEQSCCKCGDKRGYVLDYHHIDPSTKTDTIARMTSNNYTLTTVQEEIKKCVVMCANCHREWHYLLNLNPNLTFEDYLNKNIPM